MKKLACGMTTLFLCVLSVFLFNQPTLKSEASTAKTANAANEVVGDANGDGVFDVKDLIRMKRHMAGEVVDISQNADLNRNGTVGAVQDDNKDFEYMTKFMVDLYQQEKAAEPYLLGMYDEYVADSTELGACEILEKGDIELPEVAPSVTLDGEVLVAGEQYVVSEGTYTFNRDAFTENSEKKQIVAATYEDGEMVIVLTTDVSVHTMVINDEAELKKMPTVLIAKAGEGHYILGNDITCSEGYDGSGKNGAYSTATVAYTFKGIFDGCGHTISNLKIQGYYNNPGPGLVGQAMAKNSVVRNVAFMNVSHQGDRGGIIAATSSGIIENVYLQVNKINMQVGTNAGNNNSYGLTALISVPGSGFRTNKVIVEYKTPWTEPTYGQAFYRVGFDIDDVKHDGMYVIGANQISERTLNDEQNHQRGEGYGAYETWDKFKEAVQELDDWEATDFWLIRDGIPRLEKSEEYVTLDGTFKVGTHDNYDADQETLTFTIDLGAQKELLTNTEVISASVEGTNFTIADYDSENGTLTLNSDALGDTLGEKSITAVFKLGSSYLIHATINVDVYTMVINTEEELNRMPAVLTFKEGAGHYILGNDIQCTGTYDGSGKNGAYATASLYTFKGTFDGCGYTITDLTIGGHQSNTGAGFVGTTMAQNSVVKNVAFKNVSRTGSGRGGIIAATSQGKIENVYLEVGSMRTPSGAGETGNNAMTALISNPAWYFEANKVIVEYKTPWTNTTYGQAFYTLTLGSRVSYDGVYVIGATQVCEVETTAGANTGKTNYAAYADWDAFVTAAPDLSTWNSDYWNVTDGKPVWKNLPVTVE